MTNEEDMTPEQAAQFQKDNCIFCKLVSGDIPSKKIYEDNDFVGILDINPAIEGHVLLIPKQHFQILPQIPQEIVGNLGVACAKISGKIIKAFKCDGTSVFIANGAVAGQRAPHFMAHIMPRIEGDKISLNPKLADIDDRLFNTVRERLLSSMKVRPQSPPQTKSEKDSYDSFEEEQDLEQEDDKAEKQESDETELEQEHRLKKERDNKRKQTEATSNSKKSNSNKKNQADSKNKTHTPTTQHTSANKIDFDKLSRLLGK